MKRNILVVVLFAAVAVLAVVVLKQNQQVARMKEQPPVAVVVKQIKASPRPAPAKKAPVPLPETSPVESEAAPAPVPTPDAQAKTSTGTASNYFAGLASMMKDPKMKEVIRAQQKMIIDLHYRSLSKYLNMSADQLDAIKNLLEERQMAVFDSGKAMMGGSEADRKQAAQDIKSVKDDYDQKIKDLLGPQDYQTFKDYEKTMSQRTEVQSFKGTLPTDAALTDQQENDLILALYEESQTLPASSLLNDRTSDPSQFTEERIAEALTQQKQLQQAYANRAATILTPAQLEQFTKWQQQLSAIEAAGLKMAAQMFGDKGGAQPPAANQGQRP